MEERAGTLQTDPAWPDSSLASSPAWALGLVSPLLHKKRAVFWGHCVAHSTLVLPYHPQPRTGGLWKLWALLPEAGSLAGGLHPLT